MGDDSTGYAGQAGLTDGNSARNADDFQTRQRTAHVRTMVPIKVVAVHYPQGSGPGMPGPPPTLDVQLMLDQQDGQGNTTPHGIVYGIQAPRNRSGTMEIINDPVVGDMGWGHVSDRDFSSFIAANGQASPGSKRRHSLSDMTFVRGHNPGTAPKQYIMSRSDGVTINDINNHQIFTDKNGIYSVPAEGTIAYHGGDGKKGTYDFVMTATGPSKNVKARTS